MDSDVINLIIGIVVGVAGIFACIMGIRSESDNESGDERTPFGIFLDRLFWTQ